jgi:hypothetical protein
MTRFIRVNIGGKKKSENFTVKRGWNKIVLFDKFQIPRMRLVIEGDKLDLELIGPDNKKWGHVECHNGFWKESALVKGEFKTE